MLVLPKKDNPRVRGLLMNILFKHQFTFVEDNRIKRIKVFVNTLDDGKSEKRMEIEVG